MSSVARVTEISARSEKAARGHDGDGWDEEGDGADTSSSSEGGTGTSL